MSLTRFQALVARESLAEVYPITGEHKGSSATVRSFGDIDGTLIVQVDIRSETILYRAGELEPSRHLLSLIENGTYRQWDMTWNAVDSDGNCVSESLGERINYEPADRRQCGICSQWTTHEQWLTHSHGMDN